MTIRFNLDKLPQNLKAIRESRGLSQRQVADHLGLSSSATVSHYENAKRSIPLSILIEMMNLYGFNIEFRLVEK